MQYTPLSGEYEKHGGKVVDFHGWGLPIHFSSILEEHAHVRRAVGLFDCSHMGEFVIRGEESIRCISNLVIGDLVSLSPGKCRYTALTNQRGGIIDDCVALRLSTEELLLVTNAGPLAQVSSLLKGNVPEIEDISAVTAKLDVQGPLAPRTLVAMGFSEIEKLTFWTGGRFSWRDAEIIITRAGYTGEWGYEIYVPDALAVPLWRALLEQPNMAPCGLGARDTLRTEMGYPLSGQDVDETRTPVEANMERFIAWETEFPGKAALKAQRDAGAYPLLTAFRSVDKRAPRHGFELKHEGLVVGEITSGTFGPTLGCGIGLGYIPVSLACPGKQFEAGPRSLPVYMETLPPYKQATGRARIELKHITA